MRHSPITRRVLFALFLLGFPAPSHAQLPSGGSSWQITLGRDAAVKSSAYPALAAALTQAGYAQEVCFYSLCHSYPRSSPRSPSGLMLEARRRLGRHFHGAVLLATPQLEEAEASNFTVLPDAQSAALLAGMNTGDNRFWLSAGPAFNRVSLKSGEKLFDTQTRLTPGLIADFGARQDYGPFFLSAQGQWRPMAGANFDAIAVRSESPRTLPAMAVNFSHIAITLGAGIHF